MVLTSKSVELAHSSLDVKEDLNPQLQVWAQDTQTWAHLHTVNPKILDLKKDE